MALTIGLIGLPQSGKSTLFSALTTRASKESGDGKARANLARVSVPDERLLKLSSIFNPKKTTPATIDFIDVGALKEETSDKFKSAALGDKLIADIRTVDCLVKVIRAFPHPYLEGINPVSDLDELEIELYLSDLKIIEGRLEKNKKMNPGEKELLENLRDLLSQNRPGSPDTLTSEQQKWLSGLALLHLKPRIVAGNIPDAAQSTESSPWSSLYDAAKSRNITALAIPAKLESEIGELPEEEQASFLQEMGIQERGLDRLIKTCYELLGLITFFTVGEDEVKAWTIKRNTRAQEAAGKIHSDLERGFIRAEIISYKQFLEVGSMTKAKEKGLLRMEGKEYIVSDGDIINVRFNV